MSASDSDDSVFRPASVSSSHLLSNSGFEFSRRHSEIFDFFWFNVTLATRLDHFRKIAATALADTDPKEESLTRLKEIENEPEPLFKRLKKFSSLQSENICIRLVDNFICFIVELIQTCISKRPNLLSSAETIRTDDILKFRSFRELTSYLLERKVNDLAYGGIRDLENFINDRLGLKFLVSDEERANVIIMSELRNIYTHNRGIVNDVFLRRTKSISHNIKFVKGKRFHVDYDLTVQLANALHEVACRLDSEAAIKFKIKRYSKKIWQKNLA